MDVCFAGIFISEIYMMIIRKNLRRGPLGGELVGGWSVRGTGFFILASGFLSLTFLGFGLLAAVLRDRFRRCLREFIAYQKSFPKPYNLNPLIL